MPVDKKTLEQRTTFDATPHDVYEALMDAKKFIKVTGDHARIDSRAGGTFTTKNGKITGKFLDLIPDEKIVAEWRMDVEGWPKGHFSILTINLSSTDEGTQLDLTQDKVPKESSEAIESLWDEYYWTPLKEYFAAPGHKTMVPVEGKEEEEDASEPRTPAIAGRSGSRLKKDHTPTRVREDDQIKVKRRERSQ
jgi:uncharacterized protein YndB with AHSA1/START domain